MRLRFALCCCIFALSSAFAASPPALDYENPLNSQWAILDDPYTASQKVDQDLSAVDRQTDPVGWAKRLAVFAIAAQESWDDELINRHEPEYPDALQILSGTPFHQHQLALRYALIKHSEGNDKVAAQYQKLADQAAAWKEPEWQTQFLFKRSFVLTDIAPEKALSDLQDAHHLMLATPNFHSVYGIILKLSSALAFNRLGQVDRALRMFEEGQAFLNEHPLRYFSAMMNYNYGAILMSGDGEAQYDKALEAYQRSSAAAAAIHCETSLASSLLGLAQVATRRRQFAEALPPIDQAAAIFLKIGNEIWAGEAYERRARALIGLKRFPEALESLDLAERHLPKDSKTDSRNLAGYRAEAYAGTKDFAKAYQQQVLFSEIDNELKQKKISSNYAKQLADLGLEVETQRNARLQEELQYASRQKMFVSGLLGLAVLILLVAVYALWKAREVKRSRNKMEKILNHIDEGILTFAADLRIESEYSRHLEDILTAKDKLVGRDAVELLLHETSMNIEQRSIVRGTLEACLGEDPVTWDLNEGQLPAELQYGERILIANWVPIVEQKKVQRVLLSLRDVTSRRQLEQDYERARRRHESMQAKVTELIDADLPQAAKLLKDGESLFQRLGEPPLAPEILRQLHTIKGAARTLGLKSLSSSVHELESACQLRDAAATLSAASTCLQHLVEYQHLVFKVFRYGQDHGTAAKQRCLADVLRHLIPDLARRAHDLNLPYEGFLIHDAVEQWPEPLLNVLQPILLHACNNSLDHGFLFPKQRGDEVAPIKLEVEARVLGHKLWLWIRDNGNGLNFARLRVWAENRGLKFKSESELADLLFQDGQSTAEKTTATSGRGVGLSAVRGIAAEMNGTVVLHNRQENQGTELQFIFPWDENRLSQTG